MFLYTTIYLTLKTRSFRNYMFWAFSKSFPTFSRLLANIFPLFPVKSAISLQKVSINKTQILLDLISAVIEYKIQRAMFEIVILDFQCGISIIDESHKVFCSTLIYHFLLQFLNDVQLLQTISLRDIDNKLNYCL